MWEDFVLFVAVGFAAQMVDGAVGMAYGLSATSVLLSFGVPPATASASVHAAEVYTTGISGAAHWRLGNVQWATVWKLAIPGMLGGALGAYFLTAIAAETIRPIVTTSARSRHEAALHDRFGECVRVFRDLGDIVDLSRHDWT